MDRIRAAIAAVMFLGISMLGVTGASAQGVELFAVLLGGNEVTSPSAGNPDGGVPVGDLDGYGTASVIMLSATQICFTLAVHNIDQPTAAHIHRGQAGFNGPVVINLAPPVPPGAGTPGVSSGCTNAASGILTAIRGTPSLFYVNVHTQKFRNGALRGQLF